MDILVRRDPGLGWCVSADWTHAPGGRAKRLGLVLGRDESGVATGGSSTDVDVHRTGDSTGGLRYRATTQILR